MTATFTISSSQYSIDSSANRGAFEFGVPITTYSGSFSTPNALGGTVTIYAPTITVLHGFSVYGVYAAITGFQTTDASGQVIASCSGLTLPNIRYDWAEASGGNPGWASISLIDVFSRITEPVNVVGSEQGGNLFGFSGGDTITGSDNRDQISVLGLDQVIAGGGDDLIQGRLEETSPLHVGGSVDGGSGYDRLQFNGDAQLATIEDANGDIIWTLASGFTADPHGAEFKLGFTYQGTQIAGHVSIVNVEEVNGIVLGSSVASLFTSGPDTVDFNALSPDQNTAIANGAVLYDALGENDVVRLPNSTIIPGVSVRTWNFAEPFQAGPGIDTVTGGDENDKIAGGADNDILNGGAGVNTAILSGLGSAYTISFVNPLLWRSRGPDGTDDLAFFQNFTFGNATVTNDQLFAQLVSGEQIASAKNELQRLIKQEGTLDQLMIICDQLINNSQEQITAANLGAKLHSIQMLMDLGFKVAALDKGIGSALALSWKVGKVAGTVLGNELFGEREKSYSALVKSFGADLAKSLFGDKVGGLVKIGTTTWSTLDDSTKVIQLTAEWTKAIDQIRDAREKIAYYQERQFDIQENIKAIETELRDKYAIGPGLPKVRYEGESDSTPERTAQLDAETPPSALDLQFATHDPNTSTVTSWVSFALTDSQANLTLTGSANLSGTGNDLSNALIGNDGNNTLYAKGGNDTVLGMAGDDVLVAGAGEGNDTYNGGTGIDTITFTSTSQGVVVNLSTGSATGAEIGADTITAIENITGGAGNDGLTGDGNANVLIGNSGNDTLSGLGGADIVNGGLGDDLMDGGSGDDTAVFSLNRSAFIVSRINDQVFVNGEGIDTLTNIERLRFADVTINVSDLAVSLTGTNGPDLLYGGPEGDTFVALDGNDVVVGFGGNDVGYGGNGSDYLYADAGSDLFVGGAGVDVFLGQAGNDTGYGGDDQDYLFGGDGNDVLIGEGGVDVLLGEAGEDAMFGGAEGDYFYGYADNDGGYGGEGHDIFVMDVGNDTGFGEAGQDYFYMGDGNDVMYGGDGVDVLLGEGGDDTFDAGSGVDYLFPGAGGNDTVVINGLSGIQVINDFEAGSANDVIRLQGTSFTTFDQVLAATTDYGSFSIVQVDGDTSLWLIGVTPSQLTAADFLFA